MLLTLDVHELATWFDKRLDAVRCEHETRAYLAGLMTERAKSVQDAGSITLAYASARNQGSFEQFQQLGDRVLWAGIFVADEFDEYNKLYENIGRLCYYTCYRLLDRRWRLYEELADELPRLVKEARLSSGISLV